MAPSAWGSGLLGSRGPSSRFLRVFSSLWKSRACQHSPMQPHQPPALPAGSRPGAPPHSQCRRHGISKDAGRGVL